jgi:HEAT repeat protein/energy-coupling factor transporter ATP-binding protein EcfA2
MGQYIEEIKKNFQIIGDISVFSRRKEIHLEEIYVPLKLKEINLESWTIGNTRVMECETAVNQFSHMVILGAPGAGKTTLLKYLALHSCQNHPGEQPHSEYPDALVPIFINLRDFPASGVSVREVIDSIFEKFGATEPPQKVEDILETGRGILLLDGMDELTPRTSRERVAKEILSFSIKYPGCKIIVTSRPSVFPMYYDESLPPQGELLSNFKRLEIMPMDLNRIKRFIDKWFGIFNRIKADALLKMVQDDKDVGTIAQNPLILSIIAGLYDEDNEKLPIRADIYLRICDVMLTSWDANKHIIHFFSPEKKKFLLKKLASLNHHQRQEILIEAEIVDEITRHSSLLKLKKEEARPCLEEIWQRSGILRKRTTGTYHFLQLSFQEYFTALELSEQEKGVDSVLPNLADSWWEGPILFYVGIRKDAGPLIKQIQKNTAEDIFYKNLMLSGKCIANAEVTTPILKEKIIRDLWDLYKRSEFQLLKNKALAVLSRLNPSNIVDILVNQLTDKEAYIRQNAAETLGAMGSVEVLPALIMVLVKDKESKIRSQAAAALGKIASSAATAPLITGLDIDKDSDVRRSAADALGLIGNPEALPALIKSLTMDQDTAVRGAAAEALGKIGCSSAVAPLMDALAAEQHSPVRWRITMALGKLESTSDTGNSTDLEHPDVHQVLIEALTSDRDESVRESAAEALGEIGSKESSSALMDALSLDENADVRGSAAYALGFMKSEEALPVLIKALVTDINYEVRGRAAYALGRIKKSEAVPYLTAVFTAHKESLIRGNATYALGEIGGVEAIPFLIQALTMDKDTYVRYRAAEALGNTGNIMAIPPLKIAMNDEGSYYGWKVKDRAFEALEKISRRLQVKIFKEETSP